MKINTRTVKEAGQIAVTSEVLPQEIDANPPFGVVYPQPFQCRVTASALDKDVLIQGQVEGQVQLTCSRCLEEYSQAIGENFDMTVGIDEGNVELSGEISQAVVLVLPMKPLCQDQCRGLCPHCGQNLNITICQCKPQTTHSGFETLKNMNFTR